MGTIRRARFAEFIRRLSVATPAASAESAFDLLAVTLNTVEDELAGTAFSPERWQSDGRMYPPQRDNRHDVADHPTVVRYRSRAHNTYVAANGALEIVDLSGAIVLRKAGADGRHVWET
jgi:hypothetical protein